MKFFTNNVHGFAPVRHFSVKPKQKSFIIQVMRIGFISAALLLTTLQFLFALTVKSQKISKVEVRLELKNKPLLSALKIIEKQTAFRFVYRKGELLDIPHRNITASTYTVEQALDLLLKNTPFSYKQVDNNVLIQIASPVQPTSAIAGERMEASRAIVIKGQVTDAQGAGLPGVSVRLKGTAIGATSDPNGRYSITVPDGKGTLVFSYIGYVGQEIAINNQTTVNVKLDADDMKLSEVVVVGYGTQKKVNLTGAVSVVNGKAIAERPVSNTTLALQGMAPGLSVVNRGGSPGIAGDRDVSINIRGVGTLNNSSPLVLVDGVPQPLSSVAPSEIESISVLKDAASASIYGSRAGNGVILVTTKRGVKEGVSISYDNDFGLQTKSFWPESAAPGDYLRLHNEAYENAGLPIPYSDEWIRNVEAGTEPLKYPFFDFVPVVFNDNAFQQNHSLNISSGGKSGKILVAMNYMDQDGIVRNHNFERYNIRINSDLNVTKKLSMTADLMYRKRNYIGVGRSPGEIMQSILNSKQSVVGEYPNGSHDLVGGLFNAKAIIHKSGSDDRNSDDVVGTLGLKYDVIEGLSLKGYVSVNNSVTESRLFRKKLEMKNYYTGAPIPVGALWAQNFLNESRTRTYEPNYKLYAEYNKNINKHGFKVLLGYDEIHNSYRFMSASRDNFYSNDVRELDAGDPKNWRNSGTSSEWKLRSFFSRVNYTFNEKYLFEANLRYDGSSRFSTGKKYGLFPSFSAGWRIDQEDFLKDSKVISALKIRGSWGQLGNQETPLYMNVGVYNLDQGYNFNNNIVVGAAQVTAPNPNITWESTKMTNVGVDMDLYNGKFSMVAEMYWRKTSDILFSLPIAPSIGISPPTQNSASVSNRGWELSLNYNGNRDQGDFKYTIGFNISDVINKIADLKGTGPYYQDKFNIWQEGHSINTLYGYKTLGLYRSQEDLAKYPKATNQVTLGDIIYADLNNDGLINANDRAIIGSMDPRFPLGLNFGANYKGFDFTMFWQGVLKSQINLDGAIIQGPDFENFTTADMVKHRYHETRNPNGSMPRVSYGNAWNSYVSDYWMQDTKYIRLKNIQLGYTFPKSITDKLKLSKIRVYVSGENLVTFTSAKWVDPEIPAGRLQYYPQSKVKTAGLNLIF